MTEEISRWIATSLPAARVQELPLVAEDILLKAAPRRVRDLAVGEVGEQKDEPRHPVPGDEHRIRPHEHRNRAAPPRDDRGFPAPRLALADEGLEPEPRMLGVFEEAWKIVDAPEGAGLDAEPVGQAGVALDDPAAGVGHENLLVRVANLAGHLVELILRDEDANRAKLHDDVADAGADQAAPP